MGNILTVCTGAAMGYLSLYSSIKTLRQPYIMIVPSYLESVASLCCSIFTIGASFIVAAKS